MDAFGKPCSFRSFASTWSQGAAAFAGPATVMLFTYGASLGAVAALQVAFCATPFGPASHLAALLLTLLAGPPLVTQGWIRRDRAP